MSNRSKGWCTMCIVAWMSHGCSNTPAMDGGATATTTTPATTTTTTSAGAGAGTTAAPTTPATTSGGTAGAAAAAGSMAPAVTTTTSPAAAGTTAAATAGSAGAPALPPTGAPTDPMAGTTAANMDPNMVYPDIRGQCDINSGYPDDHACLTPPAPTEGMQIHVGPTNYQDATEVAKYVLKPGEEKSECWTFHTPNDQEVYYQTFVLSGRSGTHHIINTMYNVEMTDGGFGGCADPGTGTNGNIIDNLPGASKAYMPRAIVAPENADIGRKIPANTPSQADMHYYNFTDKDLIREFWMNIYSVDKSKISKTADQIRAMGGLFWSITPGTDQTYSYECPISGNGRIIALLGHYHSHGKQFTASVRRKGGNVEKVFEMYDYLDPAQFQYDTVEQNPAFTASAAGATSGMLMVNDGDTLLWDCHIVNDSSVTLTYTNEVKTGEMCNLWGESLDVTPLNCVLP